MKKRILTLFLFGLTSSMAFCALAITPLDSIKGVLVKHIGEESSHIIISADSITAKITDWGGDTLPEKAITPDLCYLLQYTLCQPFMYYKNRVVYSSFYADACLTIHKGSKILILELDYNIFKWRLIDSNSQEICRYDFVSQEFLPLLYMLFPESQLLKIKYEKYLEKYEK